MRLPVFDEESEYDATPDDNATLPVDAEPPNERGDIRRRPLPPVFAQTLDTLLHRLKLNASPLADLLRADWHKLLPVDLADRCRPGKIHRQTLYLYVPDSSTLFALRPELPRIEAALKPALTNTTVAHIRLMIDPDRDPFAR